MFYQLITFTLLATVSSIHRSTHRERASKILYNDDEFVSDRSSTIAAAARGTRSPRSNLISQTDRFLETTTTVINAPTCPRWGNIDAPAGEAPVPRRGGFAFTMRAANGASRLVVGGGERRDGGGAPRILKKLRYLSLGGTKGDKTWVNPSPKRSSGADKVWRSGAATLWMSTGTKQDAGDLFVFGGMASDASSPSNDARVLHVEDTSSSPSDMFEWFAVAPGSQEGVMSLSSAVDAKPKSLQRATLTGYGDDSRALLFGGDDGTTVQSDTWILTRTAAATTATNDADKAAATLASWSWTKHVANVGETTPSGRTGHASVSFPDQKSDGRTVIMIFGGQGQGGSAVDDGANTFMYFTETATWRAVPRTDIDMAPKAREGHTMTYMPEDRAVYLFGGWYVLYFFFFLASALIQKTNFCFHLRSFFFFLLLLLLLLLFFLVNHGTV